MKLKSYLTFLFFLLIPLIVNAKYEYLLHRSYAERYEDIDTTFFNLRNAGYDSVRYFEELSALERLAKREGDKELVLEAKWLRAAYYRNGKQRAPYLVEPFARKVLMEAEKAGNKQIMLRCYLLIALYYFEIKQQYTPAVKNCLYTYNLLRKLSVEEFPNKKEPLTIIGTVYYNVGYIKEAKKMLEEAERTPMYLRLGSQKGFVFLKLYDALGLLYKNQGLYSVAVSNFQKGLIHARQFDNRNWIRIFTLEIANCYNAQGNYDRALALLDKGVKKYIPGYVNGEMYDPHEIYSYSETIAYARLKKQDYDGALPYIRECRRIVIYSGKDLLYERLHTIYRMMATYHSAVGNYSAAALYADSAFVAADSSNTRQKLMELSGISLETQADIFNNELAEAEAEKEMQLLWRNASIVVILLTGIILLLFIHGKSMQDRQKRILLEEELKNAGHQLDDFTRSIQEKNELIEQFTAEINRYQALPCSNELPGRQEYLEELRRSVILTEEQWVNFQSLFEQVHAGYISRIRNAYKDLTPAEIRFLLLARLGLSNKEMAAMQGVGPEAIRVSKHRLLKKMNIPEGASLEEIIHAV